MSTEPEKKPPQSSASMTTFLWWTDPIEVLLLFVIVLPLVLFLLLESLLTDPVGLFWDIAAQLQWLKAPAIDLIHKYPCWPLVLAGVFLSSLGMGFVKSKDKSAVQRSFLALACAVTMSAAFTFFAVIANLLIYM